MNFLFVALGGAVGAMARYAISLIPLKTEFPFLTLITNVIGAILIGFIVGITSARDGVSRNTFQYCRWNTKKELEVKHDGARYHVSPWGLLWNDGNYYLIGYDHDTQVKDIRHYRVDKMKNILIENKVREGREKLKKLDIASYGKSKFGMYNGEEIKAEILCKNSAIGVLIDRFGTDVTILKKDEAHSRVFVKVADNKLFIHWIMAMGDNFKIIGPENLVKEVHDELERLTKQYEHAD